MRVRVNKAAVGWQWVRQGVLTFFRQPLAMSGLFFMFMAIATVLSFVPQLGTVVSLALVPAATLGLMAATRVAGEGHFPMPVLLFTAFRGGKPRTQAMLMLGALYAVSLMVVLGISRLFAGDAPVPTPDVDMSPEAVSAAIITPVTWVAMLLYVPVLMAFWHAPALVFWHGVKPLKSLFFSLIACWSNKGALFLFTLGWVGVFMVVGLALGLLGSVLGGAQALSIVVYPMVLLMASMYHTSLWFTFRASFEFDEPDTAPN
ncbi:MAG: hypothetical protein KF871_08830 [Hydrogenophaga sp.]|uniref:BPSS1780 family membrane protein n=1 Tax=Hydrogenophaga sp. TaxID=1904254 RepID=UPI001D5B3239|nr:BPSS1780 family membrane protein [Hydrogenophaga sp.]MBX3609991.1 hypothetical protein [Hydrogenophaga sp.]